MRRHDCRRGHVGIVCWAGCCPSSYRRRHCQARRGQGSVQGPAIVQAEGYSGGGRIGSIRPVYPEQEDGIVVCIDQFTL